jgi:hypothetical protein
MNWGGRCSLCSQTATHKKEGKGDPLLSCARATRTQDQSKLIKPGGARCMRAVGEQSGHPFVNRDRKLGRTIYFLMRARWEQPASHLGKRLSRPGEKESTSGLGRIIS